MYGLGLSGGQHAVPHGPHLTVPSVHGTGIMSVFSSGHAMGFAAERVTMVSMRRAERFLMGCIMA